jgi:hypothetical protein
LFDFPLSISVVVGIEDEDPIEHVQDLLYKFDFQSVAGGFEYFRLQIEK